MHIDSCLCIRTTKKETYFGMICAKLKCLHMQYVECAQTATNLHPCMAILMDGNNSYFGNYKKAYNFSRP